MPAKFDPKSLNGTHKLKRPGSDPEIIDSLACQWYEGCQTFYVIFNGDPAKQGSFTLPQLKKLLKNHEVKEAA